MLILEQFLVEVKLMFETVKRNLLQIQEEIVPCKPRIIAVTKYFDGGAIEAAYEAGLRDFGESRVIEASEKINNLRNDVRKNSSFHLIGHLQTNKVKQAVKVFDYIHSVDSVKLAHSISEHAAQIGKVQRVLIQINNANEEQKFGFSKDEIFGCFEQVQSFKSLEIVGVMNMAPLGISEEEIGNLFSEIVQIRNELEEKFNCNLPEISMGMSQDYRIAAQQGSTMLRIGRKLFK